MAMLPKMCVYEPAVYNRKRVMHCRILYKWGVEGVFGGSLEFMT